MNVAEYTAKVLSERGVKFVFGIPGGPSIPYMEAWRKAGIEFILTSHEASAAMMAGITARITGVPGVCHATFGPGAVNLASGVGCALLDRLPVIAFTTEIPDSMAGRTTQMGIDHQQIYRPLTKATYRLSPINAGEVLRRALSVTTEELPGPVHIGLPSDISGCEAEIAQADREAPLAAEGILKGFSVGETDLTEEAIRLLKKAKRPLIALGLTAARLGISPLLKEFLLKAPMPVVLTPMAKGVLQNDDPCYCGVLFHALSDRLRQVTETSDLIIGLGYDPVEYNYESWIPDVPVVHFGTTDVDMPPVVRSVTMTGPPERWFEVLKESGVSGDFLSGRGVEKANREIAESFAELATRWGPVKVISMLREELPAEAVLTCDVGSHLHLAGQYWQPSSPEMMVMTNGWSTMGFGIPSGLAVALNMPAATVVTLTGDGGFLMSAGEIMTARRYNLNIKVVVIADRELNLIKVKQSWHDTDPYGTNVIDGDIFGSNSFMGVPVYNAADKAALQAAIQSALAFHGPAIICATVPGDDYKNLIVRQ
ncbi:MAG: thiamine pyrophosphate-binding protein [Bacteroidales bacterium]